MNWSEFFAMGGYALYVWGSYTIATLVLAINVLLPWWRGRVVRRRLLDFYRLKGGSE